MKTSRNTMWGMLLAGVMANGCPSQGADPQPPTVVLSTDRRDYHQYDPILLTTKLTNNDSAELWVDPDLVVIERREGGAWERVDTAARDPATGQVLPKQRVGCGIRGLLVEGGRTLYDSTALFPSSVAREPGSYRARAICDHQLADSNRPPLEATSPDVFFRVAAHAGNTQVALADEFEWLDRLVQSGLPPPVDHLDPTRRAWLESVSEDSAVSRPLRDYLLMIRAELAHAEGQHTAARALAHRVSRAGYGGHLGGAHGYSRYQAIRAGWYLAATRTECDHLSRRFAQLLQIYPALESVRGVRDRGPSFRPGLPN